MFLAATVREPTGTSPRPVNGTLAPRALRELIEKELRARQFIFVTDLIGKMEELLDAQLDQPNPNPSYGPPRRIHPRQGRASTTVTPAGNAGFGKVGVDMGVLQAHRRPLTRSCVDWTERRPHLAGSLGAAVATLFFDQGWVTRKSGSRGLNVTDFARQALETTFGTSPAAWPDSA